MASPIEGMLLKALLDNSEPRIAIDYDGQTHSLDESFVALAFLTRQVKISSYRVDFLMTFDGETRFKLAIECDGHEWHDRTKQQAAYDRSRDRDLLCLGVFTIRFTGSEIVHSAERCAADAIRAALAVHEIANLTLGGWQAGYSCALDKTAAVRRGY